MELLGVPSGLAATFPSLRPHLCCCFTREKQHARFILRTRRLSAPPPPSPSRVQLDPSSKHIPKAQSAPDGLADDSDDSPLPAAKKDVSRRNLLQSLRKKVRGKEAVEQLDKQLLEGVKPPYVKYLMDLGLVREDIRRIVEIYPYIQYRSVDEQIRPFVELLLNVGMDHSGLLYILRKYPESVTVSIEKRFMPNMAYFESLGMDKAMRVKTLRRFPRLISFRREKIEANVAYFLELGVSAENVVKTIVLSPQVFGLSVERTIRPITEFFLVKGFNIEELLTMVVKFPGIYTRSLTKTLIPKWEFFLEMGYPSSCLVVSPQYFGYSLEGRIKPRHKHCKEHGVQLRLSRLIRLSDREFEMLLEKLGSTGQEVI